MTLKKSINFCVIFQTGKNEEIILAQLAGGLWDLIVCRALCYPQMRGKGLLLYTIAERRLKLSMESHEHFRTETAVLRGRICLCCKEAEPLDPASHDLYIWIATFQQRKPAVLCTWGSSSSHQLPQGCPAPGFHQLWGLMSPCSRVMETEAMRRNYGCLHPELLACVHLTSPPAPSFGTFADPHR